MAILVRVDRDYGDIVYLKTDPDQYPRQVIGVKVGADGGVFIQVISETEVSYHYECELSDEKDIMMTTKN